MEEFIQLDRDFFPVPDKYINEASDDNLDAQAVLAFSYGTVKWSELLQGYRTVILAEAGAGKTQEIRHITQQLQSDGKSAFFLRLENISEEFESSFEIGTHRQFDDWLNTNNEGWLFLDSVDEARLKHPKDFERAVKRLSNKIDTAYSRIHIFITSRVSAWRPKSDLLICNTCFPYKQAQVVKLVDEADDDNPQIVPQFLDVEDVEKDNEESEETFKVWSITNLSKEQVSRFVEHKNVQEATRFIEQIEKQDAWIYTTRPQDLEEIIAFWNTHKKIGSRYELMEHSIQRRLRERDQDREDISSISLDKARKGVRLLAAASTLMHESNIIVPDGCSNRVGIDCRQVLPDWNATDCHILLSRPIFDEAIYGTVRFHHRSVREFLTAEWLAEKLNEHGSRQKIEDLFFKLQYAKWVIVPSMKLVLSWLALMDEKIMRRVYDLEPEIILQGGDPGRLPLETRRQVLQAICEKMATGTASNAVSDQASVQRFANQDLSADIKELLIKHRNRTEVIYYLLQLVWQSRIQALAAEVQSIAGDKTAGSWIRNTAIKALKVIGTSEAFTTVINDFLVEAPNLERSIIAEIIDNLGYADKELEWIFIALEKAKEQEAHTSEGLGYAISRYIERIPEDAIAKFITGIDSLLHTKPFVERVHCHVSAQHGWLMPIALRAVEKLLLRRHTGALLPTSLFILAVAPACADFGEFDLPQLKHDLWKLVPQWPELNHQLFWQTVAVVRANVKEENGGRVTHYWPVFWNRPYWSFDEKDFDTIINDVISRSFLDDQLVALSLAFRLYVTNRPKNWLSAIKKSVKGNAELEKALHNHPHPPPASADTLKYRKQRQQWKRRDTLREEQKKKQEEEAVKWLKEDIEDIKGTSLPEGSISNRQHWLFRRMQQYNSNQSTKWTSGDWKQLIPDFGVEIAGALRTGLVNFWRHYTPQLRSESDKGSSTPLAIVFGLTALDIESTEVPDWSANITAEDAALACRYACHELNDFPAWLPRLYLRFPDIIHSIVLQEIYWELDHPDAAEKRLYILHKVGSYGKWIWDGIAVDLLNRLTIDSPSAEYLNYLLSIVQKSNVVIDEQLGRVAAAKCQGVTPNDQLPYWYATWIGIDPAIAITVFAASMNAMSETDQELATQIVMQTIVSLVGAHRTRPNAREAFKTADYLQRLYILAHQFIRVEDDLKHTGAYSPQLRDDARRMLFGMLKEIKGKATYLAILELSNFHTTPNEKLWMVGHARERAEMDADTEAWSTEQFIEFIHDMESKPANHQQLFSLAHQRLLDLKYDLEEGDNSIAATLAKEDAETKMRTFIAGWCRDRAAGRYTIAQEDELADGRKPDIRFSAPLVDGPVAIELKLAEKWSGPALFERLENQLCGDYLRDVKSGYGIFGLVYRGVDKQKWELPVTKQEVSFTELVEHLQNHWNCISPRFPGIERISVVGIDLTKRSISPGKK